jgi:hypothetical protein
MVPVAPIITGITLVFYIPHALYFYCKVFIIIIILYIYIHDVFYTIRTDSDLGILNVSK